MELKIDGLHIQAHPSETLLDMVKQNRTADIEAFARNYFASQGKDFDSEFKAFKQAYGLR